MSADRTRRSPLVTPKAVSLYDPTGQSPLRARRPLAWFLCPTSTPMGRHHVQCIPIGIQVRSAVRCAQAAHQTWKANRTSLPDPIRMLGLNPENSTLEIGLSKPRPHWRLAAAFPNRGWAFAFACLCFKSLFVTQHIALV